jgi:poly(3-hydroxybutyrate) depolymerase
MATLSIAGCGDASTSELNGSPRKSSSGGPDDETVDGDGGKPSSSSPDGGDAGGTPPKGDAGGSGPSNGSDKPGCKYTAHKTGLTQFQQAGGLSFNVYAPASYDSNVGHGVVVIMHGQDSNGVPELEGLWKGIANDEGLVLLAPKGSRPATNASPTGANWATADLNKVLELMTEIDDCYNVLTKKHLLWGFSEGGFYGYLLGIGAAEAFSGLAMGGANTSFARQSGYEPASATWKIPVSHVHGTQDFNPISATYQDRTDFQAAGHVFTLHEHPGGHSITAAQVRQQYDDLKASVSP